MIGRWLIGNHKALCQLTSGFLIPGSCRTRQLTFYMCKDKFNKESPFPTVQSFLPSMRYNYVDSLQLYHLGIAVKGVMRG